jgi:hypothetical protein
MALLPSKNEEWEKPMKYQRNRYFFAFQNYIKLI